MPTTPLPTISTRAMVPTAFTRAMRVFWPWQLIRFAVINLRMLRMIAMSHHTKL